MESSVSKFEGNASVMAEIVKSMMLLRECYDKLVVDNNILKKQVSENLRKIDELEQYSRRNVVEIQGVPTMKSEDCLSTVRKIGEKINMNIKDYMIDACHPIPCSGKFKILVKFLRRNDADRFLSCSNSRNLTTKHIGLPGNNKLYVNVSLTTSRKKLLGKLRTLKRSNVIRAIHVDRLGRLKVFKNDKEGSTQLEMGVGEVLTQPLSHSAARHKMAVKPKRTHGAPRRKRIHQINAGNLPVMPEVNEDGSNSGRSVTPDVEAANNLAVNDRIDAAVEGAMPACSTGTSLPIATQLKSASLPPGLAPQNLNNWNDSSSSALSPLSLVKLSRSKSSATNRQQLDASGSVINENEEASQTQKKDDSSFFSRLLLRRSGKKQKRIEDKDVSEPLELPSKRMDEKGRYVHEVSRLNRNHPSARQRVEPISIPSTDNPSSMSRMHVSYAPGTSSPQEMKPQTKDEHSVLKNPSYKVIALNSNDLKNQRKSLLKKSNSFRFHDESNENQLNFATSSSIDMISDIERNVSSNDILIENENIKKDLGNINGELKVDENAYTNDDNERVDVGVLNTNLVQEVKNTTLISTSSFECNSLAVSVADEEYRVNNVSGVYITASESVDKDFVKRKSSSNSLHKLSADDLENVSVPNGTSIINITNDSINVDNVVIKRSDSKVSLKNVVATDVSNDEGSQSVDKKPEPKARMQNPCKDEVSTYVPVPAPRFSKRPDNVSTQVPEFLKVHLNHVDNKQSKNVVLSKNASFDHDDVSEDVKIKRRESVNSFDSNNSFNEVLESVKSDMKSCEEVEVEQENIDFGNSFVPVVSSITRKTNENVLRVNDLKQQCAITETQIKNELKNIGAVQQQVLQDSKPKSETQMKNELKQIGSAQSQVFESKPIVQSETQMKNELKHIGCMSQVESKKKCALQSETQIKNELKQIVMGESNPIVRSDMANPVPNPRYSIVSIKASGDSSISEPISLKNKSDSQIVRKKSIVKDKSGSSTETEDKSMNQEQKSEVESPKLNFLRKKSFNDDVLLSSNQNESSEKVSLEIVPNVVLRQKQTVNDVVIVEATQKQKKSSLDSSLQQIPTALKNEKNLSKSNENVKENYRNSFGSCDTLLSQDGSASPLPDVVYRRKSLTSREVIMKQKDKDDEPELLKVFARRSLKIRDTDFNLTNEFENSSDVTNGAKSRDSDKENECGDSPPEERKKIIAKDVDNKNIPENIPDNSNMFVVGSNKPLHFIRTQKSSDDTILSSNLKEKNQNSYEKRQRTRISENEKHIEPPTSMNQSTNNQPIKKVLITTTVESTNKDKEVEIITKQETITLPNKNGNNNDETEIPLFKRIQQRKEEWERRAQLAMKRTAP